MVVKGLAGVSVDLPLAEGQRHILVPDAGLNKHFSLCHKAGGTIKIERLYLGMQMEIIHAEGFCQRHTGVEQLPTNAAITTGFYYRQSPDTTI